MRKAKNPIQIMKSPDMFRDSFQQFDVKTGQRVSYGEILEMELEDQEPEPTQENDPEQLTLTF